MYRYTQIPPPTHTHTYTGTSLFQPVCSGTRLYDSDHPQDLEGPVREKLTSRCCWYGGVSECMMGMHVVNLGEPASSSAQWLGQGKGVLHWFGSGAAH